jgi:hypothetical protein
MQAMRFLLLTMLTTLVFLAQSAVHAAAEHEADRKQLLKVFDEIVSGINQQNIDRMLTQMDPNATVLWLNAGASRGHAKIKA